MSAGETAILGIDPGLRHTGWGVVAAGPGGRLRGLGSGTLAPDTAGELAERLAALRAGLAQVIAAYAPAACAVEEVFVNRNPTSTLKLGMARGACLLAPAEAGLAVHSYSAGTVKKAVVGTGGGAKQQVQAMVARLLPGLEIAGEDAADALAVAICHGHHSATQQSWHSAGGAA